MINRSVGILLSAALMAVILIANAYAAANHVEFRPVLLQNELKDRNYDVVEIGGDKLYVWRLHYLSESDLDKVEVKRSVVKHNSFIAVFKFNDNGKRRLYRFTKKFAKRQVAIFVDGKLITAPLVWIPHFTGDKVAITWPGSERDLSAFVREVNKGDPSLVSLYIDEQAKYHEVASEEWAKYYGELNKMIEERCKSFNKDVSQVEAYRDLD